MVVAGRLELHLGCAATWGMVRSDMDDQPVLQGDSHGERGLPNRLVYLLAAMICASVQLNFEVLALWMRQMLRVGP